MFHLFLLCFISFPEKLVRVSSIFSRYMLLLNPTNPSDATYACNSIVYFLLYSYVVINVLLRVFLYSAVALPDQMSQNRLPALE